MENHKDIKIGTVVLLKSGEVGKITNVGSNTFQFSDHKTRRIEVIDHNDITNIIGGN